MPPVPGYYTRASRLLPSRASRARAEGSSGRTRWWAAVRPPSGTEHLDLVDPGGPVAVAGRRLDGQPDEPGVDRRDRVCGDAGRVVGDGRHRGEGRAVGAHLEGERLGVPAGLLATGAGVVDADLVDRVGTAE